VGMGALISSTVNQWTLLIGTLPIVFLVSAGEFHWFAGLPLDARQHEEIFLTAAQSAFAIAVFVNLKMSTKEAVALFILFATQLFIPSREVRVVYAAIYTVLCITLLILHRRDVISTVRVAIDIMRGKPEDEPPPAVPTPGGGK